jgi:hypothetical protein
MEACSQVAVLTQQSSYGKQVHDAGQRLMNNQRKFCSFLSQSDFNSQITKSTENRGTKDLKIKSEFWRALMLLSVFLTSQLQSVASAETQEESLHRAATAIRIKGAPPQLDGILDDDIWKTAPLHEGFRQRDPDEGEPASERTTFQIAYDDEALYFGIVCYDSEPDKLVAQLVRRDNVYVDSDKININLDPHYNRQSAYWFTVHPSGSVTDGIISDNKEPDRTWDGVWDAKTRIHTDGWTVEYKIPFHLLHFSPKDEYVWGLQVNRTISRKKEESHWRLIKKDEPGWVSRLGDLTGIKDIHPSRHLEFMPYAFTPTLSLQFYLQPFITIGDYTNFKELVEPKSYRFNSYVLEENHDFHRRSLRGNTVLRWEFRPGSTLFLVWSQSRAVGIEEVNAEDLEFRPLHRLGSSFTDDGKNIFLIKCRYWFGV